MALASKKTPRVIDLSNAAKKAKLQAKFDDTVYLDTIIDNPDDHPELAAILLQVQNINDDMDLIRTFAGDVKGDIPTTTITSGQASAITANTAKTGISAAQDKSISASATIVNKTQGTLTLELSNNNLVITSVVGRTTRTYVMTPQ